MTVREFTVIKPKIIPILVKDEKSNEFKNIDINISDDMLYDKIIKYINVLSSSWTVDGKIKITTDSEDNDINKCLKKCDLIITENRTDLKNRKYDLSNNLTDVKITEFTPK